MNHTHIPRVAQSCPSYNDYSKVPHAPYSGGKLKLPFMRPSEECRTFTSPAVEVRFNHMANMATYCYLKLARVEILTIHIRKSFVT